MAVDNDMQADELRKRMAQLRSELAGDVYQVSESARAMADWRYYVRRFPLGATAALAAAGYLIVPRKAAQRESSEPDLAQLLEENKIMGDGASTIKTGSMFNSLVSAAGAAALRMATAFVAEKIKSSLHKNQPESPDTDEQNIPSTSHPR